MAKKVKKSKLQTEMDEHMGRIMDTFMGADGCHSYISLRGMVIAVCDKADEGDVAALDILEVVRRFRRLIDIADKHTSMKIDL